MCVSFDILTSSVLRQVLLLVEQFVIASKDLWSHMNGLLCLGIDLDPFTCEPAQHLDIWEWIVIERTQECLSNS